MLLLFFLILFLLSGNLFSQELLRSSINLQEGVSLLYRIEDYEALAEIRVIYNREGDIIPSRFILETDQVLFGSFTAAGMWKYIEMESLLSAAALEDAPGLKADRSSQSALENPGAAYLIPEKGGILCSASEDDIQSALWATFFPGHYTSLSTGISLVMPDGNPENTNREDWYSDTGTDQYTPLFHSVSELKTEGTKMSFSLLTAMSAASLRIPGFSVLPTLDYYGSFWDINSRVWFNTQSWLNSSFERTDSMFHLENLFSIKLKTGIRGRLKWSCDADFYEETALTHGLQCRTDLFPGACPVLFEYNLLPPEVSNDDEGNSSSYSHTYRLGAGWNRRSWSFNAEGELSHDKYKLQKLKTGAELKRRAGKGGYSRLRCILVSVPGLMTIKPVYEESFCLGNIGFRISGGYEFTVPSVPFTDESLSLSLTMEWKGR